MTRDLSRASGTLRPMPPSPQGAVAPHSDFERNAKAAQEALEAYREPEVARD